MFFSVNIFISTEDSITEKLLLFKIISVVIFNLFIFLILTIFAKSSILDIWQQPEHASTFDGI